MVNWLDRENPQAGGAEVQLHETFGRLAERGHDVTLLASGWKGASETAELDGMRVVRTGSRYTFPPHAWWTYHRRLRRRRFDLVVEDVNKLPLFTPLWRGARVVALVPHLFGTVAFREEIWPVAATVWAAERLMPLAYGGVPVHAASRSTKEDLVRRGFEAGRVRVIHNGVDHDFFRPDPGGRRFEEPTLAYVGRLKRYKELDVVLEAVARLQRTEPAPRLLVAGKGDDRPRLEAAAAERGVAGRVEFLGYVSEDRKREILRRAWVVVYPSPKEGWGLTNVEAAACGTPVVASDSPGLRESVRDGESGLLVPHADAGAWADALRRLLTDEGLRARLAEGGVRHAAAFSWERAAAETEEELLDLVHREGENHASDHRGAAL